MTTDILVKNGTIVTASEMYEADLTINRGKIEEIRDGITGGADKIIDATDQLVMPGVVDPHVHVADPFSIDSYESASRAAAIGGTTSLIGFAFQAWNPETEEFDSSHTLTEAINSAKKRCNNSLIDIGFHGAVTQENEQVLNEVEEVIPEGIPSIKMFTAYDVGLSNGFIHRVFERLSNQEGIAVLHTEDGSVCDMLTEVFQSRGEGSAQKYPASRPDYAEAMAAENAVQMAKEIGTKYYGIHTSCRKSAEVIDRFREDGSRVRAETCTHYTTLDESVYSELGNLPMIAPPIRKRDDIESIFKYLKKRTLDIVSTDHCAYSKESKQVDNWWDSSFGANSLQTGFHVFQDEAINRRGLSYPFLVRAVSAAPADTFGLPQKGTLRVGSDADIIIFDPHEKWTIDSDRNESNADFSIYEGRDVIGRVKKTLVRGHLVADNGDIVGDVGHGKFLDREIPDWSV